MKTNTVTLYAHLASALVNGDTSGLDLGEQDPDLVAALAYLGDLDVVDVGESYFGRPDNGGLRGDVADYTVLDARGAGTY